MTTFSTLKMLLKKRIEKMIKKEYESIFCSVRFPKGKNRFLHINIEESNEEDFFKALEESFLELQEKEKRVLFPESMKFALRDNRNSHLALEDRPIRASLSVDL